jgi:hypothetical protein
MVVKILLSVLRERKKYFRKLLQFGFNFMEGQFVCSQKQLMMLSANNCYLLYTCVLKIINWAQVRSKKKILLKLAVNQPARFRKYIIICLCWMRRIMSGRGFIDFCGRTECSFMYLDNRSQHLPAWSELGTSQPQRFIFYFKHNILFPHSTLFCITRKTCHRIFKPDQVNCLMPWQLADTELDSESIGLELGWEHSSAWVVILVRIIRNQFVQTCTPQGMCLHFARPKCRSWQMFL